MKLSDLVHIFLLFKSKLSDIKSYIEKAKQEGLSVYRTELFYNGLIISIYGAFEQFVDEVAEEFLNFVYKCKELDEDKSLYKKKLEELYLYNLGDFLMAPKRHTNIDNSDEKINQLISSLLDARTKSDYSRIDKAILLFHGGNMKSEAMYSFFSSLGLKDFQNRVCRKEPFVSFLKNELGIEESVLNKIASQTTSDVYLILNRLVDERNLIAHRGLSQNKIALDELQNKTIEYLSRLSEAITRVLVESILCRFELNNEIKFFDGNLIHVFDNLICCHSNENHDIKTGDYFVFKKGDGGHLVTKIVSIQLNNNSISNTGLVEDRFGFKVDEAIKQTYLLEYLLQ